MPQGDCYEANGRFITHKIYINETPLVQPPPKGFKQEPRPTAGFFVYGMMGRFRDIQLRF